MNVAEGTRQIWQLLNINRSYNMNDRGYPSQDVAGPWRLENVPLKIFGAHIQALLGTGAVPSLVSVQLCKQYCLKPEKSERNIKATDGSMAPTLETLREKPIFYSTRTALIDLLILV